MTDTPENAIHVDFDLGQSANHWTEEDSPQTCVFLYPGDAYSVTRKVEEG